MVAVTGDPAAMRAAAARLRLDAEILGASAGTVDSTVAGLQYAGPAADAFRTNVAGGSAKLRSAAARMNTVADLLARQAVQAEDELRRRAATEGATP